MKIPILLACLAMVSILGGSGSDSSPRKLGYAVSKLLDNIRKIESNGDCSKIGKVGELGCYQIRECYWIDALEHDPSIGGEYEDVIDREYAEEVILAYWDRYATIKRLGHIPTDEDRARIHNGGPNGHKKTSTIEYWNKIKKELND
jgi:hypothetical protein